MQNTRDLFPDHPAPVPGSMMELIDMPGIKLSAAQRAFKQRVADLDAAEKRLQELTALIDVFRPLFLKKLQPIQAEQEQLSREMVLFLDERFARKGWTSGQRKTMREIICTLAERLFDSAYGADIEAVFDRHSDIAAADSLAVESAELATDLEELFGLDLGGEEGGARSPDEMLHEAMRQLDEREREAAEKAELRDAARRGRKKSARQTKEEQQALDAGKLLKEIYRKLTSAIHPDREPDEAERARKTALMSAVNQAYESGNLMKLLQLQLQAVKVDARATATLADEKLQLINRTLGQQHRELRMECQQLESMVREEFGLNGFGIVNAAVLQKSLNAAVAAERADIKVMRRDLSSIKIDDAHLKRWLNEQRQLMKENERMDELMAEFMMGFPSPKRRR